MVFGKNLNSHSELCLHETDALQKAVLVVQQPPNVLYGAIQKSLTVWMRASGGPMAFVSQLGLRGAQVSRRFEVCVCVCLPFRVQDFSGSWRLEIVTEMVLVRWVTLLAKQGAHRCVMKGASEQHTREEERLVWGCRKIPRLWIKVPPIWYLPMIFLGYALIAGRIWKGDIMIADIEELEKMDASEMYPQRINAKEVLMPQKGEEIIFPLADGTAKLLGRDCEFREPTLRREQTERSQDLIEELQGEPQEPTLKPEETCGLFEVT